MKHLALCLCLLCGSGLVTGCAFLAGTQKAIEAYEQTQADVKAATEKVEALAKRLADIKREYDDAVKSGDKGRAEAALIAGQQALVEYQRAVEAWDATKKAYENAAAKLKDAKTTEDYIGSIVGIGLGILGGVFGGSQALGKNRLVAAVKATAANVEAFVPTEKWDEFKRAQLSTMSDAAVAAFDKARKG